MNLSIKKPFFRNTTVLLFLFWCHVLPAQDYAKAWDAILNNQFQEAHIFLEKAKQNPATAADAALTQMILKSMEGDDDEHLLMEQACNNLSNPYPYYYAWWYYTPTAGEYGLKSEPQLKLLEKLLADKSCPEMLKAAARYQLLLHWMSQGEVEKGRKLAASNTNIINWQFTGPFDNVSESGFDKNYPPVTNPAANSQFKALNNAEITWFTPGLTDNDGWVMANGFIKWDIGIAYAQAFVTAPSDMEVFIASGFTGTSFKLWVNDRVILSEAEERGTDFDVFKAPVSLKKGVNRVLVQIGLTDSRSANFSARFVNREGELIKGLTPATQSLKYPKAKGELPEQLPFFAEVYFQDKIKQEPDNPLNYFLLTETYFRSRKNRQALEVGEQILQKHPDNLLFRFQKLRCWQGLNNRTALTEEIEAIQQIAPNHLLSLIFKFEDAVNNEQFDTAQELLDTWKSTYGASKNAIEKQVNLLLARKKYAEALEMIDAQYKADPTDLFFVSLQHNVELHVNKKPEAALSVYEELLKKNYYLPFAQLLAEDYLQMGMNKEAIQVYEKSDAVWPSDFSAAEALFSYYFNTNDVPNAQKWVDKLLSNAPFHATYWKNAGELAERNAQKEEALRCFQKALHYFPNDYDNRRKIRELQQKPEIQSLLPAKDPFALYTNSNPVGKEGESGWYYVLDEQFTILHPEGNQESDNTLVIKVLNETGVDYWKESSIGYDDSRQKLIIEKAEVIKPSGSRFAAEKNDNQLVFTNLQEGDGLYIHYRLSNYAFGRMAREFFASYYLNSYIHSDVTRYVLLAPDNIPLTFHPSNVQMEPVIKALPDEKMREYLWEVKDEPILESEYFAPATCDVAKVIHVSSLSSWSEVASWYGDLSATQAKADYDVQQLSAQLFPKGTSMTQKEKVHTIYDWILSNIRYSSVDFRQSGYVPQRASKVIQTKLGDCKDLSTLFASLAREAGIKANLVLVNTRDQGTHAMELPSTEFNHCIVKVMVDNVPYFLELTNPELPFGCLPNNDINAFVLEIPFGKNDVVKTVPYLLNPDNRCQDVYTENTQIEVVGRDLVVNVNAVYRGVNASDIRNQYKDLPGDKQIENMQQRLAKKFTNTVAIKKLLFGELNTIQDSIQYQVQYAVKKEITEIGGFNTFKIPFFDVFINADAFPEETRTQSLCFWKYENSDLYREEITIAIPSGKNFTEIPKDIELSFHKMTYKLIYQQLSQGTLKVVRTIVPAREEFPVAEYPDFRTFMDEVITAETRWVAYK